MKSLSINVHFVILSNRGIIINLQKSTTEQTQRHTVLSFHRIVATFMYFIF